MQFIRWLKFAFPDKLSPVRPSSLYHLLYRNIFPTLTFLGVSSFWSWSLTPYSGGTAGTCDAPSSQVSTSASLDRPCQPLPGIIVTCSTYNIFTKLSIPVRFVSWQSQTSYFPLGLLASPQVRYSSSSARIRAFWVLSNCCPILLLWVIC